MTDTTTVACPGAPRRGPVARLAATAALSAAIILATVTLAIGGHTSAGRWLLVVASTGFGAASAIPSIRAVAADPASLRPVTWAIWAALTVLAAVASARAGDWPSAIFSLVGTATCTTVTIVVLRRGSHTTTMLDTACLLLGLAGLLAWQTLHQPGLAVLAACAGDLAALTPTIIHAWHHPHEEPTMSFALIAAGGLCTTAAAWGHWTITALAYPLYVAVSTAAVALLTLRHPTPTTEDAGHP